MNEWSSWGQTEHKSDLKPIYSILTCMLIRISKSVLVIGSPPSSQWRRWMSWASSVSSSWQRASSDTHRRWQRYLDSLLKHVYSFRSLTTFTHSVTRVQSVKAPLEVASMSWVCCSQADTLLFTPVWVEAVRAGLPSCCWYNDAELTYFRGWKQKHIRVQLRIKQLNQTYTWEGEKWLFLLADLEILHCSFWEKKTSTDRCAVLLGKRGHRWKGIWRQGQCMKDTLANAHCFIFFKHTVSTELGQPYVKELMGLCLTFAKEKESMKHCPSMCQKLGKLADLCCNYLEVVQIVSCI